MMRFVVVILYALGFWLGVAVERVPCTSVGVERLNLCGR